MDILGFVVIAGITVGTHVLRDLDLPPPPPVCETKLVKAATGNYYYQEVDMQGDCTYVRKEY